MSLQLISATRKKTISFHFYFRSRSIVLQTTKISKSNTCRVLLHFEIITLTMCTFIASEKLTWNGIIYPSNDKLSCYNLLYQEVIDEQKKIGKAYNDILFIKALGTFNMNNSFYDIVAEISDAYLQHCIFFLWYLIIPLLLPTSNFYGDNCHLLVSSITNKREQRLKMRIIDNLSLLPAAIFVPFCGGRYFLLIYLFM